MHLQNILTVIIIIMPVPDTIHSEEFIILVMTYSYSKENLMSEKTF